MHATNRHHQPPPNEHVSGLAAYCVGHEGQERTRVVGECFLALLNEIEQVERIAAAERNRRIQLRQSGARFEMLDDCC